MLNCDQSRALFMLQTDLIETKVERYAVKSISEVVQMIVDLKHEMHQEMHQLRCDMGQRLSAVETALGIRNEVRAELRTRFFDYGFKIGWMLLAALPSFILLMRSL